MFFFFFLLSSKHGSVTRESIFSNQSSSSGTVHANLYVRMKWSSHDKLLQLNIWICMCKKIYAFCLLYWLHSIIYIIKYDHKWLKKKSWSSRVWWRTLLDYLIIACVTLNNQLKNTYSYRVTFNSWFAFWLRNNSWWYSRSSFRMSRPWYLWCIPTSWSFQNLW